MAIPVVAVKQTWAGTDDAILKVAEVMRGARGTPDIDFQKAQVSIRNVVQN